MADPTVVSASCTALEGLIRTALVYDPASRRKLAALEGRVLAIEVRELDTTFYLLPDAEGLRIQSYYEGNVDSRLRGSVPALLGLLGSERFNLKDSGVEVFGSTGLLVALQEIADSLEIDWEEALSQALGDVLGPQSAAVFRGLKDWLQARQQTAAQRISEYLTEELKASPSRPELEFFHQQVDELRLAADRLAARIDRLRKTRK